MKVLLCFYVEMKGKQIQCACENRSEFDEIRYLPGYKFRILYMRG